MAKNSIRDYSATNSSNTDIQSIDISEGCSPAGINNAIREVMADLKDVSTGAVALESPAFDSASLTGDLTFGDNDKAIFGAGSDLQIYHDASHSYIKDAGTGQLRILATDLRINNTANDKSYITGTDGAEITLYHNGSGKLATTSTGVDVTSTDSTITISGTRGTGSTHTITTGGANSQNLNVNAATDYYQNATNHIFRDTSATELMRIDSSGNLLVGKTSSSFSTDGVQLQANGELYVTRNGGAPVSFNRRTSDGSIVSFAKDGTTVGSIGAKFSGRCYIASGSSSNTGLRFDTNFVAPCFATGAGRDNAIDLGSSGARFDDIYATNGTIQTSDANEKQQIAALTDAEITAAKAISQLFKTFKWNSAVEAKGDAARTHTGVIAQDVEAAMTAAGLDAGDYAFFISTTWWETQTEVPAVEAVDAVYEDVVIPAVLDDDGNEIEAERTEQRTVTEAVEAVAAYTRTDTYDTQAEAPAGATERTRKGIRYPELLAFVGAATEQRLVNIETRLAALEAN